MSGPLKLASRLAAIDRHRDHGPVLRVSGPGPAHAAGLIEDAGFSVFDDLLHGFGGGYLPPVLGTRSRPAGPLPEMTLEAGMTCVVQLNVVTRDGKAGVQVGELVLVTDHGFEPLHAAERALFRLR
jgi:Xaa-Pro dipeptidase